MISDNKRHGIHLRAGNHHNLVADNVVVRNGGNGIHAENATSNTFTRNTMLDNALFDARDDAFGSNLWTANTCMTDYPVGAICGVGSPTGDG